MTKPLLPAALIALSPLAAPAAILGEFWDADGFISTLDTAQAIIDASGPDATFTSTGIDYPNGDADWVFDTETLATFLGTDAASLSSNALTTLEFSVFRFTGQIALDGLTEFSVGSDDGFQLTIDDTLVSSFDAPRPFDTTTVSADLGTGLFDFELIYFEDAGLTGIEFFIDGEIVTGDMAPIPLPAGGALLLTGLAGLALKRRRQTA